MKIREYQKQSYTAVQPHETIKDAISHWTIGLTEEAGEVASLVKHKYYNEDDTPVERIAEELGDVLWYMSAICTELGIDLETVAKLNIAKLEARYRNNEYNAEDVHNRHENFEQFSKSFEYSAIVQNLSLEGRGGKEK